jgi:predicted transcriptional regulator
MKVLLSIKPEYAEKILTGQKRYEFRKAIFKTTVEKVVIYATSPIKKIIGEFEIDCILSLNPNELWERTMFYAGVNKEFYDKYFNGKGVGYAIKVKNVRRYASHFDLNYFNIKQAPQSFIYIA